MDMRLGRRNTDRPIVQRCTLVLAAVLALLAGSSCQEESTSEVRSSETCLRADHGITNWDLPPSERGHLTATLEAAVKLPPAARDSFGRSRKLAFTPFLPQGLRSEPKIVVSGDFPLEPIEFLTLVYNDPRYGQFQIWEDLWNASLGPAPSVPLSVACDDREVTLNDGTPAVLSRENAVIALNWYRGTLGLYVFGPLDTFDSDSAIDIASRMHEVVSD